jgi:hypothetical protein
LFTANLLLQTLWSTPTFTVTFWHGWEKMCDEKTGLGPNHNWLHHDNAPTHTSLKTREFVTNKSLLFPILLTRWIQPPVISLCFQNWKWNWCGNVLKQWHSKGSTSTTRQH